MGYVFAILFVLLGLYKKDSVRVTKALFVYFCILIGFNVGSADAWVYETMYNNCFDPSFATHEPGYILLCKIFRTLGFSFLSFRIILAMIMAFFDFKAISYFTKNVNFAVALFLIFPFCGSPSGLRNSVAGSMVLYAVHFLFEQKPRHLLKYYLMILLATMFHYNSVFFLILPIATIRKIKFPTLLIATLASIPVLVLLAKTNLPYIVISWFTSNEKILNWFTFSFFFAKIYAFTLVMAICALLLMYYSGKLLPAKKDAGCIRKKDVILMSKIGSLTLISFSGAIFSGVVYLRFLIALMPLYYAVLSETLAARQTDDPKIAKLKLFLRIGLVLFCIFLLWFVYGFWIGGDAIQNFQKNLFFIWQ